MHLHVCSGWYCGGVVQRAALVFFLRGRTHCGERGCLSDRYRAPQDRRTSLHWAAEGGHAGVVEQLLAAGANTEAKDYVRGQKG